MTVIKKESKRVNIYLPVHQIELIDNYAEKIGSSRSVAISVLIVRALEMDSQMSLVERMLSNSSFDFKVESSGSKND